MPLILHLVGSLYQTVQLRLPRYRLENILSTLEANVEKEFAPTGIPCISAKASAICVWREKFPPPEIKPSAVFERPRPTHALAGTSRRRNRQAR